MPDAAAAERTSLFRAGNGQARVKRAQEERTIPSFSFMAGESLMNRFEQQHATCTKGPSLPSHMPEATAKH